MSKVPESITAGIRKLRLALGETQQSLANKLGIAISTMVRYETNRPPHGEALVRFMKLADANSQPDLAKLFQAALARELGHEVVRHALPARTVELWDDEEAEIVDAVLTAKRLGGTINQKALAGIMNAIAPIIEVNRKKDVNASINLGFVLTIQKHIDAGLTDEQILAAVPRANADNVATLRQSRTPFKKGGKK
jgi:transcriptional regulator with XRE-family HTH domain